MPLAKAALRAAVVLLSLEAASFAADPSPVDVRVDLVAREVDRTLGATLRDRAAPALVHEHIASLIADTREALRQTPPLRHDTGRPERGVVHLGAGLTLDGGTLRGSWRGPSFERWRHERTVQVDARAITLRTRDGAHDHEIELTPVRLGWRVSTTRRADGPMGPGPVLGRETHYLDRRGAKLTGDAMRARERAARR